MKVFAKYILSVSVLFFLGNDLFSQGIYNSSATIVITNGSNIYIDGASGNYRNEGTGTITNNTTGGIITLAGNWTNNGSTNVFSNNGSTVILNGAAQNLTGTSSTSFFNLTASGSANKIMGFDQTVSNTLTLTGRDLSINGNTLTLAGTETGTGKLIGSNTSSIIVNGSGAFSLLELNNSSVANKTLNNLTINRSSGTVTMGSIDSIFIRGTLTVSAGFLATGGKLVLLSDASGTARYAAQTCGSCGVNGNVIAQRYIPGGPNKRKWRFLSSPINVSGGISAEQLIDNIHVTGGAGSTGFDIPPAPYPNNPSVRIYTESVPGTSDNGWNAPTAVTDILPPAYGFELFVRGTRTLPNPYDVSTVPNNVTLDFIGTLNTGTYSPAITRTNNGVASADGFNLIGNPYASQISWQASGWTRTNIENRFWCYNPNTSTYGIWDGTLGTGTNGITAIIASGQGFFVKATTSSPVITFTENIKVATTPFNYYRQGNTNNDQLILSVHKPSQSDEWILNFDDQALQTGNDHIDATKFVNHGLNFYSITEDGQPLTIDSRPKPANNDMIILNVSTDHDDPDMEISSVEFEFVAESIPALENNLNVYLHDQYLQEYVLLADNVRYPFTVNDDEASKGSKRFSLIFSDKEENSKKDFMVSGFALYPNPATDQINIKSLSGDKIMNVIIYNNLGQIVYSENYNNDLVRINDVKFNSGLYHALISSSSGKKESKGFLIR